MEPLSRSHHPKKYGRVGIEKDYQDLDEMLNSFADRYLKLNEEVARHQQEEALFLAARVKLMVEA